MSTPTSAAAWGSIFWNLSLPKIALVLSSKVSEIAFLLLVRSAASFLRSSTEVVTLLITEFIPEPYFFNDQIVVKQPHESFLFEEHRDNQYGPYPNDKTLVTINCMLILDDYTDENGAIKVDGKTLYPKTGDILLIEGNTLHSSNNNNTDNPRRAYICVYSDRPIGKDFQKGFYYHKFDDNSKI